MRFEIIEENGVFVTYHILESKVWEINNPPELNGIKFYNPRVEKQKAKIKKKVRV